MADFLWRTVLSLVVLSGGAAAPTSLSPGDVAIIGYNYDNPDEFGFVVLVDLDSGTQIYFTDSGVTAEGTFRGGEGAVKYTVPGEGIPAGSVIIYTGSDSSFVPANDSHVGTGGLALSSSGDQIIAFQGSSASPSFIYALNAEGEGWQPDANSSNETALPPGLIDGSTALALMEADNGYYSGTTRSGTQRELLQAISLQENWTTSNSRQDSNTWPSSFAVSSSSSDRTTVQFSSSEATVSEGTSSYSFSVSISNQSPSSQTTADVVLTSNGTATGGTDISQYTPQTVTFPEDSFSAQSVTVFLIDDSEFEGTETLVFELKNAAGGNEASVGSPDRFVLSILDNDPPAVVINEIHYNPAVDQGPDDEHEFLELYNRSPYTAYLSGYNFREGIQLTFGPSDSLAPGSYLLVAKRAATYPGSIEWTAGSLANVGERVVVVTGEGTLVDSVMYAGRDPWPMEANGSGPSLELVDPWLDNSLGKAWQASFVDGGTPGGPNSSNSVPRAMPDSFSTGEDQALVVDPPGVLENDSDSDGDILTPFMVGAPVHGGMALSSDGGFQYIPDPDFFGQDTFVYAVHDGTDSSSPATGVLKVMPVNDPPDPFGLLWPEDSSVIVITRDLLSQPFIMGWESTFDRDGDSVTYELAASGELSFLTSGGIQESRFAITYQELVDAMEDSDRVEGEWIVWASDGIAAREADNGPFRLTLDGSSLAVGGKKTVPTAFALYPNIPNPFNPFTVIPYDVPQVSTVQVEVYDLLGRRVQVLFFGTRRPGTYEEVFTGKNDRGIPVASGIYICRMVAFDRGTKEVTYRRTRKLVLMR
ncbi:MAG: Ig-like domain-containing protein [Fidelibacterota bacterium]